MLTAAFILGGSTFAVQNTFNLQPYDITCRTKDFTPESKWIGVRMAQSIQVITASGHTQNEFICR